MSGLPTSVHVKEVSPRDGLQGEPRILSTEDKLGLLDCRGHTGLREIEVSTFVSPKAMPALADAAEVFARLRRRPGVTYSAIVPDNA